MAKGYLIAQIDVHDGDAYAKYTAQTPGTVATMYDCGCDAAPETCDCG